MDIERALENVIKSNQKKKFHVGETHVVAMAEDCLSEIKRLKATIALQTAKNKEVHLCNDCEYGCMAACPITKNVRFGNGLGNDNVIECENYINKEALKKWRINKITTGGIE